MAAAGGQAPVMLVDSVPGTLVSFEMVRVPSDSQGGGAVLWIGRTEVTWELYDVFALQRDLSREDRANGVDAESRPSRPYGAPDYGFGHNGYPVISVTHQAAESFCVWLSSRTGRTYRLPTEAEWARAADLALGAVNWRARLDDFAWHATNSDERTHPVGAKSPDALGLFDMLGNAAEWAIGPEGPVVRGGSFRDAPEIVSPDARATQVPAWQLRDPQIPKSRWWLSDGPFVGFRIVHVPDR